MARSLRVFMTAIAASTIVLPGGTLLVADTAAANTAGTTGSASSLVVRQVEFPPQLLVRGERVQVGFTATRGVDGPQVSDATGVLYVKTDISDGYTAVPLRLSRKLGDPSAPLMLRAFVPDRFLLAHRVFYYARVRSNRLGGSVVVPAGGARAPESAWIVNDARRVNLGPHVFGQTRTPDAVVATAGPGEVGFNYCPAQPGSCGDPSGPPTFEVTKTRQVWLFDFLGPTPADTSGRLMVWNPGQPTPPARTLQLPFGPEGWNRGTDFATGPGGSVYVLRGGLPNAPPGRGQRLTRLAANGKPIWTSWVGHLAANTQLRTGPDGTLYWTGPSDSARDFSDWMPRWVPVATSAGRPISQAAQELRTQWTQPLPGGRQLVRVSTGWVFNRTFGGIAPHEARLAIVDRAGRVVRAWRVTSPSVIWWYSEATPALVGGDPVIVLTATKHLGAPDVQIEYLVLRLGPNGGIRTRFSLPKQHPPQSAFNDRAITQIRVQPDGWLYQLGSAPDFGVAISRHSLRRTR